jgi:hypothetical protein
MLDVLQPCFTQSDVLVQAKAYGAWRALVANFRTDPNWTATASEKSRAFHSRCLHLKA